MLSRATVGEWRRSLSCGGTRSLCRRPRLLALGSVLGLLLLASVGWQRASDAGPPTMAAPVARGVLAQAPAAVSSAPINVGCSATACHGDSLEKPRDWMNSQTAWSLSDPHRRATELLFTPRAREIYLNLYPERRAAETVEPAKYDAFLRERCLTCHATADAGNSKVAKVPSVTAAEPGGAGELVFREKLERYLEGVTCAACHGDAAGWIDQHYLRSWPETGAERTRLTRTTGFLDLRDRQQAAQVCARCHVGQPANDRALDQVNHDLIAAGHPRLRFELDTYLTNLPTHWNRDRADARYRTSSGGSPHVDAWRHGQIEHARRLLYIGVQDPLIRGSETVSPAVGARSTDGAGLGFAGYQCFDCHQSLSTWNVPRVRVARSSRRASTPRLTASSLENVLAMNDDDDERIVRDVAQLGNEFLGGLPLQNRERQSEFAQRLQEHWRTPLPVVTARELPQHVVLLRRMLARATVGAASGVDSNAARSSDEAEIGWTRGWDEAVDLLFAVRALEADWPPDASRETLTAALDRWQSALQEKNGERPLARYDSPTEFDPARLREPLLALRAALDRLADSRAEAERP